MHLFKYIMACADDAILSSAYNAEHTAVLSLIIINALAVWVIVCEMFTRASTRSRNSSCQMNINKIVIWQRIHLFLLIRGILN